MTLFAALAIPVQLTAQQQHHHYKLIDLGTFGGPTSSTQDELQVLNTRGMVAMPELVAGQLRVRPHVRDAVRSIGTLIVRGIIEINKGVVLTC